MSRAFLTQLDKVRPQSGGMTRLTSEAKPEILYIAGAARFLGTTEKAVRQQIARRQLPFRRRASRIFFIRAELERFLDALDGCRVDEALENVAVRERS